MLSFLVYLLPQAELKLWCDCVQGDVGTSTELMITTCCDKQRIFYSCRCDSFTKETNVIFVALCNDMTQSEEEKYI